MKCIFKSIVYVASLSLSTYLMADTFTLKSEDITEGKHMSSAQEFSGFGCQGANQSPQLSWSGVPEGTKAFALFAYDPDAPTGSGWWHWQVVNIPSHITSLPADTGREGNLELPKGSKSIKNDYGVAAFGGACPPKGHGIHRYQFTLFALSQTLVLPENPSSALTGYMVKAHSLASSTLEALYKRD